MHTFEDGREEVEVAWKEGAAAPLLNAPDLYEKIRPSDSAWYIDGSTLVLTLTKQHPQKWPALTDTEALEKRFGPIRTSPNKAAGSAAASASAAAAENGSAKAGGEQAGAGGGEKGGTGKAEEKGGDEAGEKKDGAAAWAAREKVNRLLKAAQDGDVEGLKQAVAVMIADGKAQGEGKAEGEGEGKEKGKKGGVEMLSEFDVDEIVSTDTAAAAAAAGAGDSNEGKLAVEEAREVLEEVRDANGRTALHFAASKGHVDACRYVAGLGRGTLMRAGTWLGWGGEFWVDSKVEEAREVLEEVREAIGRTALHFAASKGHVDACRYMVEEIGVPVDVKDDEGETPLMLAARDDHSDAATWLVQHGASVATSAEKSGAQAIHHAAGHGSVKILELLLDNGADPNAQSDAGPPLLWACGHGKVAAAGVLLTRGANPDTPTEDGVTSLLTATAAGETEIVKLLLKTSLFPLLPFTAAAPSSPLPCVTSTTPLIIAADAGNTPAVSALLAAGADADRRDEEGMTALDAAAAANRGPPLPTNAAAAAAATAAASSTNGAATAAAPSSPLPCVTSTTPLIIAADAGNTPAVSALLAAGADADRRDEEGMTALDAAAAAGNKEVVGLLLPVTQRPADVAEGDWTVEGVMKRAAGAAAAGGAGGGGKGEASTGGGGGGAGGVGAAPPGSALSADVAAAVAEAKARGDAAFRSQQFQEAVDSYTQALDLYPKAELAATPADDRVMKGTLLANRSICWLRLGQAPLALADGQMSRSLRPDWPKAYFREGSAFRAMERYEDAANVFFEGVQVDPNNMDLTAAFQEAIEAGRKAHKQKQGSKS
ncbi:unnamed protein product [Closterium sp. Naga37s-1]|nr:unnamed protein product [Closterium sp. Naga37s-1]